MLFAGLFCTTFATLLLEILDSRLLSVLTWYHLSFLAVSLAMLGMAAGAIRVFVDYQLLDRPLERLPGAAMSFALSVGQAHLLVLCIPLTAQPILTPVGFAAFAAVIGSLTVPFYWSGVIVTLVLTRSGGDIGRLYAFDLAGAAFGCAAIVPLLDSGRFNLSSLVVLGSAGAAVGGLCFSRAGGKRGIRTLAAMAAAFAAAAVVNGANLHGLDV